LTNKVEYLFDTWEEYKKIFLNSKFDKATCGFMRKTDDVNYAVIDYVNLEEGREYFLDWIEKKRVII
jgi:hypothetical protein